MPFAAKFRAMMAMPFPGDQLGDFTLESISVGHEGGDFGYRYPIRLLLRGPGSQDALKKAVAPLFKQRVTTFSGFGTPYHLWFGKPAIEKLGGGLYAVTAEGRGIPVRFEPDLARFCAYLYNQDLMTCGAQEPAALVEAYLADYQKEIARLVGRYNRRIRREEKAAPGKPKEA